MQIIAIEDAPSQRFTIEVEAQSIDCQFMFNQIAGQWSITVWHTDVACPLVAGRLVFTGVDLFEGCNLGAMLMALDRPGIFADRLNWYERLSKPLSDGVPATFLVQGTAAEFSALLEADALVRVC